MKKLRTGKTNVTFPYVIFLSVTYGKVTFLTLVRKFLNTLRT